eukprot:3939386-Rhodomonas_salina.10
MADSARKLTEKARGDTWTKVGAGRRCTRVEAISRAAKHRAAVRQGHSLLCAFDALMYSIGSGETVPNEEETVLNEATETVPETVPNEATETVPNKETVADEETVPDEETDEETFPDEETDEEEEERTLNPEQLPAKKHGVHPEHDQPGVPLPKKSVALRKTKTQPAQPTSLHPRQGKGGNHGKGGNKGGNHGKGGNASARQQERARRMKEQADEMGKSGHLETTRKYKALKRWMFTDGDMLEKAYDVAVLLY